MELIGYPVLNKQLITLGRFQQKTYSMMKSKEGSYRKQAKNVVRSVVYAPKANPKYPRSGNMLAATDVMNMKDDAGDAVTTNIFMNPEKASRSFKYEYKGGVKPKGLLSYWNLTGKGGFKFYAAYVRIGVFFKRKLAERDFVAGWLKRLKPDYIKDVGKALRKF